VLDETTKTPKAPGFSLPLSFACTRIGGPLTLNTDSNTSLHPLSQPSQRSSLPCPTRQNSPRQEPILAPAALSLPPPTRPRHPHPPNYHAPWPSSLASLANSPSAAVVLAGDRNP
jgi:hypothetical protein